MTGILCKSSFLAAELSAVIGMEKTLIFPGRGQAGGNETGDCPALKWLSDCLQTNSVSLVLYEPRFFIDPSQFRSISPKTRFVVLASQGDEQSAQKALFCGACAVIDKPLLERDLCGVLSLVSQ